MPVRIFVTRESPPIGSCCFTLGSPNERVVPWFVSVNVNGGAGEKIAVPSPLNCVRSSSWESENTATPGSGVAFE